MLYLSEHPNLLAIRNIKHSMIGATLFSTHCGLQHVVGATRCQRRLKLPASRPSASSLTNNASFCNTLATQLNAPRPTPDHMESDVHVAHSPRSLVRTIGEVSFHKISHQPRWTLTAILTSRYAASRSTRYFLTYPNNAYESFSAQHDSTTQGKKRRRIPPADLQQANPMLCIKFSTSPTAINLPPSPSPATYLLLSIRYRRSETHYSYPSKPLIPYTTTLPTLLPPRRTLPILRRPLIAASLQFLPHQALRCRPPQRKRPTPSPLISECMRENAAHVNVKEFPRSIPCDQQAKSLQCQLAGRFGFPLTIAPALKRFAGRNSLSTSSCLAISF